MKIAVWYNVPFGGSKRTLYDHLAGLKRRGHEVEIWSPAVEQSESSRLSEIGREHVVPYEFVERDSSFYPLKVHLAKTRSDRMIRAMAAHSRACAAEMNAGKFDVLFANTDTVLQMPMIACHVNIPSAVYLGEPMRKLHEAMPRLPWLKQQLPPHISLIKRLRARARFARDLKFARAIATAECENALCYTRILVNSRYSREVVLRTYGVDARVMYPGIETGIFRDLGLPRERFVLSVGSLTPPKNPMFLVRSVAQVPEDRRPPLVWVYNASGPPGFEDEVAAEAKAANVELVLRKFVPDEELVSLLNRASAFVYAPRLEPLGMAPLEAGACGTPVVAVPEGGVRETVEDGVNGLLVENDPKAFGAAILRLLDDPALARRLGEGGKSVVRTKWNVERTAEELERNLIEAACFAGPVPPLFSQGRRPG